MALPILCLEYVRKASKRWIVGFFDEISLPRKVPVTLTLKGYDSQTGGGETSDSLANPIGAERRKPRSHSILGAAIGIARAICTSAI